MQLDHSTVIFRRSVSGQSRTGDEQHTAAIGLNEKAQLLLAAKLNE
jgi:hypothetical protein